ncbi:uncharacterized protein TNCV_9361 [Trichonephila clavipes]|nr:uncharacterized protein TNCV_9361 [Trichonephila clavipes]
MAPEQPSGMSKTSCSHMYCPSCNGSQEPFLNKTILGLTWQGYHKTVSALLLPFVGLPDSHICLHSSISGIIKSGEMGILREFERTRTKVTVNMERNVSRYPTELVCLNARSYRIVHSG